MVERYRKYYPAAGIAAALILLYLTFFQVRETEFVLITQFGRPLYTVTDPGLNARLGGTTGHLCLGLDRVVVSSEEKRRLSQTSGASLVDMESGAVAAGAVAAGVPFAVVRAICDPAHRTLPPAALVALDTAGRLLGARLALSILIRPGQLAALFALARDAAAARRALRARAMRMSPEQPTSGRTSSGGDIAEGVLPEELLPEGIL